MPPPPYQVTGRPPRPFESPPSFFSFGFCSVTCINENQLSSPHRDDTITLDLSEMYFPSADAGTSCGTEAYATIQQAHADRMAYIERRSAAHLLLLCFARPSSSVWRSMTLLRASSFTLKSTCWDTLRYQNLTFINKGRIAATVLYSNV